MVWSVNMMKQTGKNTTFIQALKHAWDGIVYSFKTEKNMRTHMMFAILVIVCGVLFQVNIFEWVLLVQCVVFILFAELVNSVIEKMVDVMTQQQYYTWAKHVKDMASAAVLLCAGYSVVVGIIIFVPKIIYWLR